MEGSPHSAPTCLLTPIPHPFFQETLSLLGSGEGQAMQAHSYCRSFCTCCFFCQECFFQDLTQFTLLHSICPFMWFILRDLFPDYPFDMFCWFFKFYFNIVYIVERNTCSQAPQIRQGQVWRRRASDINVSVFYFPLVRVSIYRFFDFTRCHNTPTDFLHAI